MIKTIDTTKVTAYHLFCDRCGAEMEATNIIRACGPPIYEHKCPKCNNKLEVYVNPSLRFQQEV